MRFLLDNDVDAAVRRVLINAGHEAWTADQAGLAGPDAAMDDDLSIYAQNRSAVVMTHDREFSERRIRNTFGRHVWLRCEQPDAALLVAIQLESLITVLESRATLVVEVSAAHGVQDRNPHWD